VVNDHDDDHDFWLVNGGTTTPRARTTAGSAHFDNLRWWRGNTRLHYWYFCDRRWIYAWIWHYWRHAGAHDRNLLRWYMNNNWLRSFRMGRDGACWMATGGEAACLGEGVRRGPTSGKTEATDGRITKGSGALRRGFRDALFGLYLYYRWHMNW
jgi:hypothetical protein